MSNIYELAEQALLKRQKLPDNFGPDALRPAYDGLSLANVTTQALEWLAPDAPRLGAENPVPGLRPELLGDEQVSQRWQKWQSAGPINQVVVLLMDALGYDQLKAMMTGGVAPNLARAAERDQTFFMPLTSVFPSTTTTALTSVATGHAPAQHGIMGTWVYMREIGTIVDLIGYRPAVAPTNQSFLDSQLDPDTLVPVPNIYRRLEAANVQTEIVNLYQFKGSSISRFTSAGSQAGQEFYNGYLTPADGFSQLRRRIEINRRAQLKTFTYAYIPNIDSSAHRYGPLSTSYQAELAALDFTLQHELFEPLAGQPDVALLLVADHGQRNVEQDKILWLEDHPALTRMFTVPHTGESRAGYLHIKHGCEEQVQNYVKQNFGEDFLALSKKEAVEQGLFGLAGQALGPECEDRIGDIMLIPTGNWVARQHTATTGRNYSVLGNHGGLSRAEMLIPFLAYRF